MKPTVVVGYERTLAGGRALLEAGHEAAFRGADVTVVHAFHPDVQESPRGAQEAATATAAFGAGVLRHRYPSLSVRSEALAGISYEVLAGVARSAELLVLGSSHEEAKAGEVGEEGHDGQPLGPVAEWTLLYTPCPVMVVRGPERYPKGVVLAAVDIEEADEVVNFAFAEARFHSARLRAVSALDPSGVPAGLGVTGHQPAPHAQAQAALDRILAERMERGVPVPAHGEIVDGPPPLVLTAAAAHADLVVTGARRRGGGRGGVRIGPVTDALLRGVACPVVVVPHF